MKSFVKYFIGILTILILNILRYFVKIKFCHIYSSRIGHLTINFDSTLLSISKNTILLCTHEKKISNKFILEIFKKQKNVFFKNFFKYFYNAILTVNPNSNFIINWKDYGPSFSFKLRFKSKIQLPSYSDIKLEKVFSKYNVKKDFVCLHARNNLYLQKHGLDDKNFHNFRNFDFDDYALVIEYLKNRDNSVIKLGETFAEESFKIPESSFFTSKNFNLNEEIDYLISAYSRYNIIGNSGVSGISYILRKKIIYANLIPLSLPNLSYCSPGSIILPKKIFDIQKGRLLTFKENTEINFSIHSENDPYLKNNLSVVNNSPQEILDAAIEMDERLEGNGINSDAAKFNDQFWKSITNNNEEKINFLKNELKLSVSYKFLKDNQNLL
jgi:putative glycosyltransferase (TIGR04372 family)